MSEFSKKIKNELILPSRDKNKNVSIIAEVIAVKNNRCDIEFINENGESQIKTGIQVKIYGNETSGAYAPEVEDSVIVEYENGTYTIIGKVLDDSDRNKADSQLKADLYSNLIYDIIPGNIFWRGELDVVKLWRIKNGSRKYIKYLS